MHFKYIFVFIFVFLMSSNLYAYTEAPKRDLNVEVLKTVPIQHGGRIKPLDTFAREVVQTVTGRSTFQGISAVEMIFSWMFLPKKWSDVAFIEIPSLEIKKKLDLSLQQKYYSAIEILKRENINQEFQNVHAKSLRDEKLTPYDEAVRRLSSQLSLVEIVSSGELIRIVPHPEGKEKDWLSLAQLSTSESVATLFDDLESSSKIEEIKTILQGIGQAYDLGDKALFNLTTIKLKTLLSELPKKEGYPYVGTIEKEVFYNEFRPFRKAWILYFTALVLLILYFVLGRKYLFGAGGLCVSAVAFAIHIFGFVLRCTITGRPPVGTMYESVIWVSLGIVFFAFLLLYLYKNPISLAAGTAVAAIGLVLSDNLPLVLDPTIRPLAPVLRSNFWLTIHVLTITLSYAAFALAMGIGNWTLFKFISRSSNKQDFARLTQMNYRSMQIGVLLLAAGTILGGVWADYSWGRFWGWDPKEVWALIALLFYLAIVHGKYAGWLKVFGTAAGAVLAFQGVIMAWYGVNFVLGAGLHSYGFGSGGVNYVATYLILQIAYILVARFRSYGWQAH